MKFGKDFKKQMIPEWVEAYMDYNGLKGILRDVRSSKEPTSKPQTPLVYLQNKLSMYKSINWLAIESPFSQTSRGDIENQVIDVCAIPGEGNRTTYKTKLLLSSDEGAEAEIMFFNKLDQELNKVNLFFRDKVEEVLSEASILHKQMEALLAFRIKVRNKDSKVSVKLTSLRARFDSEDNEEKKDPMKILDYVKVNSSVERPFSVIKNLLKDSKDKDLNFSKEELKAVEERMKLVLTEFYQKLSHLKRYSFMNLSAFSKIMKKYEKITTRLAARSYMKIVDKCYIGSSDEVSTLLAKVEDVFSKNFYNENRKEAMKLLRRKTKREKHRVTFFSGPLFLDKLSRLILQVYMQEAQYHLLSLISSVLLFFSGFFTGCAVALMIAIVLMTRARKLMDDDKDTLYLDSMFLLYSLFAYIVLHMLMYAANIYFWKRTRVNYPFIFGFKQGTELGFREVFLLSTGLAVFALTSLFVNVSMIMESRAYEQSKLSLAIAKFMPFGLVMVVLSIIVCPFNVIYRSSRVFLIKCLFRCICAPLYEVTLPDFYMADQLTSQVQAIRSLEFYICYYGHDNTYQTQSQCHNYHVYNVFYFIVAVIPYWIRCLQCLRRLIEERDSIHAFNGLKYFLTIVAVVIRTMYELQNETEWLVLAIVSSAIAMVYQTYWDLVMDWGLLRLRSKNFLLRDKLLVSHKSVYYGAMAVNVLLRVTWLQLVLKFKVHTLEKTAISTIIACLEIIRRGIWSFFRLENEHLNNVGKYRAFRSVPPPFHYHDANGEDDNDKDD